MTQFRGVLVSGSKDKSMKFWDINERRPMFYQEDAHKAGITAMGSDEAYIYTGCKDNIVKAWQFKELTKDQIDEQENLMPSESESKEMLDLERQYGKYKVDVSSYMIGHEGQVNSICAMNDEYSSIFTGSSDKSLKLWRR